LALAEAVLALSLAASGTPGAAARPLDPVSLWIGGFQPRSDTTISAGARSGDTAVSGRLNLERDLGLDRRQPVSHARMDFLLGGHQGLSLEYFGFRRANRARLARDFEYDGRVYEAEAELRGELDYAFASASWRWWFGEQATAWGLGLGVAHYRVGTLLEGQARVDDVVVDGRADSRDAAFAPLLALGWRHAVNDQLRLYAEVSGVAKAGGPLDGHIVDTALGLEWFPLRRLGLALEYGGTQIRLDRRRAGDDGQVDARLDLKLRGPSLFLRLR
jgi:hypothetical protein